MKPLLCVLLLIGTTGVTSARDLSIEERVAAQREIERVLWAHRIWPETNPGPKPPLEEVVPEPELRARVDDYLRKSAALQTKWDRAMHGAQLQAELDRMQRDSKSPELLAELFEALGNDPFLIVETLVRQRIVDRHLENAYGSDTGIHAPTRRLAEDAVAGRAGLAGLAREGQVVRTTRYVLEDDPAAASPSAPGETRVTRVDTKRWEKLQRRLRLQDTTALPRAPLRVRETRTSFFVEEVGARGADFVEVVRVEWPKRSLSEWWSAQKDSLAATVHPPSDQYRLARRKPAPPCEDDTWTPILDDTPPPGEGHTAVWTGSEMIVWGGDDGDNGVGNGGRYDPATDTWRGITMYGAARYRTDHTAVWTGREMIVWGGTSGDWEEYFDSGASYDPVTDSWRPTSMQGAPPGRWAHTAVWTGHEMIVWGGWAATNEGRELTLTGGRYNPRSDSWKPMTIQSAPVGRQGHTAVWTEREMIVWGGVAGNSAPDLSTGGRYNPRGDVWRPLGLDQSPTARTHHTAVWTGTDMIVWGGHSGGAAFDDGALYRPRTDSWSPLSREGAPSPREGHTAVWTGQAMVVWGGRPGPGGQYFPGSNRWVPVDESAAPEVGYDHTAVWTGDEMIVYGGGEDVRTGGR